MNDKLLLLEKMGIVDPDFKYNLNEADVKMHYAVKLSNMNEDLNNFIMFAANHELLSGNINEDYTNLTTYYKLITEDKNFDPFADYEIPDEDKLDFDKDCFLYVSKGNAKIKSIPSISLPAGYTCKNAQKCKTFVPRSRKPDPKTGLLARQHGDIQCFAAAMEASREAYAKKVWTNFDLLRSKDFQGKVDLLYDSIKFWEKERATPIKKMRMHVGGDFYDQEYADAWIEVARRMPETMFYAYTTAADMFVKHAGKIPENVRLVASAGAAGNTDEIAKKLGMPFAHIVMSPEEAKERELPIDLDDRYAQRADQDFALPIHGKQKKGSPEGKASYRNQQIMKDIKKKYNL